ncbi:TlpA family protein disulfide reductase [Rhodospirillum rubrum]|uniref:TlpA family protein disulfide reductase n=1 Tax=Rhodospirillum rubrum TaxID=1085 RepID=UPI00190543BF|nr:TlpA disulfide reductase family protein [Rhodospirillum rubrum]
MRHTKPAWGAKASVKTAALGLALVLGLAACKPEEAGRAGAKAPDLAALTLEGTPTSLRDHAGRVVVVNFWLGGCAPCLTEMPTLEAFHRGWADKGVDLMAINVGGNAQIVRKAITDVDATFPFLVDELSLTASRYEVAVFPTTLVIDRQGIVRARFAGEMKDQALAQAVLPLL